MSIASEIERLQRVRTEIFAAITAKGVSVPVGSKLADCPRLIASIGGQPLARNTIRCKFASGYVPTIGDEQTLVDASENIWDIFKESSDWTHLFTDCANTLLEVLDANTSNVTKMNYMFSSCKLLTTVPLFNTSKVTDMSRMFEACTSLTTVPKFNTSNVTSMSMIFEGCTSLTSVPEFDTSNVTDMRYMFNECTSLTSVPLFNTSNVTKINFMFYECTSLTSVPLFDTSKVTDMSKMFDGCISVESGALALYQQASTQSSVPTHHEDTFRNCGSGTSTGAAELAQIPDDWK